MPPRILKKNQTLKYLNISFCNGNNYYDKRNKDQQFDEIGIKSLCEAIKMNPHLKELDLSFNELNHASASRIAECLSQHNALQTLNLEFNKIGDAGAIEMSAAMINNTSLQTLNLRANSIGDEGCKSPRPPPVQNIRT